MTNFLYSKFKNLHQVTFTAFILTEWMKQLFSLINTESTDMDHKDNTRWHTWFDRLCFDLQVNKFLEPREQKHFPGHRCLLNRAVVSRCLLILLLLCIVIYSFFPILYFCHFFLLFQNLKTILKGFIIITVILKVLMTIIILLLRMTTDCTSLYHCKTCTKSAVDSPLMLTCICRDFLAGKNLPNIQLLD